MLELRLGKPLIVVTTERYQDYLGINKHYIGVLRHYGTNSLTINSWNDRVVPYKDQNTAEKRLGLYLFPQNPGNLTFPRKLVLQFYPPLNEKVIFVEIKKEPQYKALPRPDGSPIIAYALPDTEAEAFKFILECVVDEALIETELESCVREFLID